jgi:23S rRNA (adenine2030-N6)-methyltransferase
MIIVNPPFRLEAELRTLLPVLRAILAASPQAKWTVEWLATEATEQTS